MLSSHDSRELLRQHRGQLHVGIYVLDLDDWYGVTEQWIGKVKELSPHGYALHEMLDWRGRPLDEGVVLAQLLSWFELPAHEDSIVLYCLQYQVRTLPCAFSWLYRAAEQDPALWGTLWYYGFYRPDARREEHFVEKCTRAVKQVLLAHPQYRR